MERGKKRAKEIERDMHVNDGKEKECLSEKSDLRCTAISLSSLAC